MCCKVNIYLYLCFISLYWLWIRHSVQLQLKLFGCLQNPVLLFFSFCLHFLQVKLIWSSDSITWFPLMVHVATWRNWCVLASHSTWAVRPVTHFGIHTWFTWSTPVLTDLLAIKENCFLAYQGLYSRALLETCVLFPVLFQAIVLCFRLHFTKDNITNNTAAATVRQVVTVVFERMVAEDEKFKGIWEGVMFLCFYCIGIDMGKW